MIPADENFENTWPFAPHFTEAAGFRQHFIDEGSGRPVLLLHGQPTWGYIYRNFIPALAATHRVVVPDHMGFGKSETPPDGSTRSALTWAIWQRSSTRWIFGILLW
jgi:pimeloyl-ACP methyl ester carboxylesterase